MSNPTAYRKFALILDEEVEEERILIEWLENNKGKRNSYSTILKRMLTTAIEEESTG